MKNQKYTNSDGFLSAYSFACGYVERRETDTISLEMYKEHNVYHVRFNRFDLPYATRKDCKGWDSFDNITEAKNRFFQLCDTFRMKRITKEPSVLLS